MELQLTLLTHFLSQTISKHHLLVFLKNDVFIKEIMMGQLNCFLDVVIMTLLFTKMSLICSNMMPPW